MERFTIPTKILYVILVLLILSPIFAFLADAVGYHEPLDIAAEELGLEESNIEWTPLSDYSVPGLSGLFPYDIGYLVAGIIGVAIIFGVGYLLGIMLAKNRESGAENGG